MQVQYRAARAPRRREDEAANTGHLHFHGLGIASPQARLNRRVKPGALCDQICGRPMSGRLGGNGIRNAIAPLRHYSAAPAAGGEGSVSAKKGFVANDPPSTANVWPVT